MFASSLSYCANTRLESLILFYSVPFESKRRISKSRDLDKDIEI